MGIMRSGVSTPCVVSSVTVSPTVHADLPRQIDAQDHAGQGVRRTHAEIFQAARDEPAANVRDALFQRRVDALEPHGAPVRSRRLQQRLIAHDRRRGADHAGHLQPRQIARHVVESAVPVNVDVRAGSDDPIAQLALHAGHERQRDDERHHADADPEDRDGRNDGDERLAPARGQVAAGDEPGHRHG
jgi:hypothetical protein